jgi:prepilin-type N-terminal cleavage/methylation domain-containing protein
MTTGNNKKGFTLVELAIVLVIIGLLVGGVLQGQELIKQAQIRSMMATINDFDTSVNTFRAKYDQLPGDFSKASNYGLNLSGGAVNVAAGMGSGAAVGDGDGNGFLAGGNAATAVTNYSSEIANFWVHLSNTGLVKGAFNQPLAYACTAATGVGCNISTATGAYPEVPIGSAAIALTDGSRLYYILGTSSGMTIAAGTMQAAGAAGPIANNLTPEEAASLDNKLDNGLANSGILQQIEGVSATGVHDVAIADGAAVCKGPTVVASPGTGIYNVALTTKVCTVRIRASS